jgi:glycosyltransferase involved in cell wall biosynthesis
MKRDGRLKVVHLVTLLELGGAQGNTIHTVRHLDASRYDARLWCGKGAYWDQDVEKDLGAAGRLRFFPNLVRPVNPLKDFLAIFDLARALKAEKPDILHTHSSKAGILGRIAARMAGVPVVVHTFHGFGFNDRQPPSVKKAYVALERWTARFADALVFVSIANREEARRLGIGQDKQYRLIRSGVDLEKLASVRARVDRADVRRRLGAPEGARLVTTLSAFKPQKNLADFIDLAARVGANVPDAHFVLIGDGEQRGDLTRLAREKGIQDRVSMPGWRRDAGEILAGSDVFVLTSLWEGLPRALVEAGALGIPSLCYDTDGVRDLLTPEAGELVPQGDVSALADGVERLLRDVFYAQAMADGQSSRITGDFDIYAMVRQQEKLYGQLMETAGRGARKEGQP